MAEVPRLYVPIYFLIRVPLLILIGVALALLSVLLPLRSARFRHLQGRDIALVSLTVIFPLTCQVICRGPAFTGLRHFLFVLPALATLAGIGLDSLLSTLAARSRVVASGGFAIVTACFLWDAVTLAKAAPVPISVLQSVGWRSPGSITAL